MQAHSAAWDASLTGSFTPVVQVDAWYDGRQIAADLPVTGSVTVDTSRLIVTAATISAASPDGALTPVSWASALGCYGSELHVRAGMQIPGSGPELMSLGWLRIDSYDASEAWAPYPTQWVPRGVRVPVQCSDRMSLLDDARFMGPAQPVSLTSALTEIIGLCQGIVPVENLSGVADAAIPKSLVYSPSRSATITALAVLVGCVPVMSPNGALSLLPVVPSGASVWSVSVAAGAVPLASWVRHGDRASIYNAVVSTGTSSGGIPVQGIATETTGALRFGGPFGRVPYFRSSPLIATQSAAQADATTRLASLIAQRTVVLPVTCPVNYALQGGDIVDVVLPGGTVTGPVVTITFPLDASTGTMQVGVSIPRASLWVVQ